MAVKGLTPARIDGVEKDLKDYFAGFKSKYMKTNGKEPNSLHPAIIAVATSHGEMREVAGDELLSYAALEQREQSSLPIVKEGIVADERRSIGGALALLYSNGSIEWKISHVDHGKIMALSAERKVLAARLYKETLKADRSLGVQMGRQRMVDDRYDRLFFVNPNEWVTVDANALINYGNVQTKKTKRWNQVIRGVNFFAHILGAYISYKIFFNNRFLPNRGLLQLDKPLQGIISTVGIAYVAAGLIIAFKSFIGGLINI